ncbi:MAG TPA: 30S ribosomal protein S6 [Bacteroidales bacterium]|nr:30S ribosomal protein S6 [Bacteroidales bacterium]
MLNHYEAVFILTPVLSDAQMKEAVEKFKAVITDNGGTITNEENWGMRKLAYPIQKKSTGFYTLLQFDVAPSVIATLETQFRRDERVLRFLTFRLDKYAYEYAEKRKRNKAQPKAETEVKATKAEEVKEETKEEKED